MRSYLFRLSLGLEDLMELTEERKSQHISIDSYVLHVSYVQVASWWARDA